MNLNAHFFVKRVLNLVRPKPRYIPLKVDDILNNFQSKDLVDKFNDFYYSSGAQGELNWKGTSVLKNPCDLWTYIELFQKLKPSVIIETGTHHGGSAFFYSDILKTLNIDCTVITIDFNPKWSVDPKNFNIHSLVGISTDSKIIAQVESLMNAQLKKSPGHVMVMLDSDHSEENVTNELHLYSRYVTKGSYLIVEDTNVNGHPSFKEHGPGPWEATQKFLAKHREFKIDLNCQKFLLTNNPSGFLKKE